MNFRYYILHFFLLLTLILGTSRAWGQILKKQWSVEQNLQFYDHQNSRLFNYLDCFPDYASETSAGEVIIYRNQAQEYQIAGIFSQVQKLDINGKIIWTKEFKSPRQGGDIVIQQMVMDRQNNCFLSFIDDKNIRTLKKLDNAGNEVWTKTFEIDIADLSGYKVLTDNTGNLLVIFTAGGNIKYDNKEICSIYQNGWDLITIFKISPTGELLELKGITPFLSNDVPTNNSDRDLGTFYDISTFGVENLRKSLNQITLDDSGNLYFIFDSFASTAMKKYQNWFIFDCATWKSKNGYNDAYNLRNDIVSKNLGKVQSLKLGQEFIKYGAFLASISSKNEVRFSKEIENYTNNAFFQLINGQLIYISKTEYTSFDLNGNRISNRKLSDAFKPVGRISLYNDLLVSTYSYQYFSIDIYNLQGNPIENKIENGWFSLGKNGIYHLYYKEGWDWSKTNNKFYVDKYFTSSGNNTALTPTFSYTPTSPQANQTINFKDESTGSPTSWAWDFGDGTSSNLQNPTKTYTKAGTYIVKLTVSKTGATSQSISKSIDILAPILTLSKNTDNVAAAASTGSLTLTTNSSWTASSNATWLKVSPTNGNAGTNIAINYTTDANTTTTARTGVITLSAGGLTQTFTVTQAGAVATTFTLSTDTKNIPATGETGGINLTTNNTWTASSNATWLKVSPMSGNAGTNIPINYTIDANITSTTRTGIITFTSGGTTKTFTVTQAGAVAATLKLSVTSYTATADAFTQNLGLEASANWTAQSDAFWLTISPTSGTSGVFNQIRYGGDANASTTQRVGTITFTSGTTTVKLVVTQAEATATGLTKDLIAHYPFTGNANNTIQNKYHGILGITATGGVALTTDRNNTADRAYNFDGTQGNIELANMTEPFTNSAFSVSAWYYTTTNDVLGRAIFSTMKDSRNFYISVSEGKTYFVLGNGTAWQTVASSDNILNGWHQVVATFDPASSTAKIYVDGKLANTRTNTTLAYLPTSKVYIGNHPSSASFAAGFKGKIDEVRYWTRAIDATEVQQLYTQEAPTVATPTLTISKSIEYVAYVASTGSLTLTTNNAWTANSNATWLKVSPTNGNASTNLAINYTIDANTTTTARTGIVTFTAGGLTKTLTINQAAAPNAEKKYQVFGGFTDVVLNPLTAQISNPILTNLSVELWQNNKLLASSIVNANGSFTIEFSSTTTENLNLVAKFTGTTTLTNKPIWEYLEVKTGVSLNLKFPKSLMELINSDAVKLQQLSYELKSLTSFRSKIGLNNVAPFFKPKSFQTTAISNLLNNKVSAFNHEAVILALQKLWILEQVLLAFFQEDGLLVETTLSHLGSMGEIAADYTLTGVSTLLAGLGYEKLSSNGITGTGGLFKWTDRIDFYIASFETTKTLLKTTIDKLALVGLSDESAQSFQAKFDVLFEQFDAFFEYAKNTPQVFASGKNIDDFNDVIIFSVKEVFADWLTTGFGNEILEGSFVRLGQPNIAGGVYGVNTAQSTLPFSSAYRNHLYQGSEQPLSSVMRVRSKVSSVVNKSSNVSELKDNIDAAYTASESIKSLKNTEIKEIIKATGQLTDGYKTVISANLKKLRTFLRDADKYISKLITIPQLLLDRKASLQLKDAHRDLIQNELVPLSTKVNARIGAEQAEWQAYDSQSVQDLFDDLKKANDDYLIALSQLETYLKSGQTINLLTQYKNILQKDKVLSSASNNVLNSIYAVWNETNSTFKNTFLEKSYRLTTYSPLARHSLYMGLQLYEMESQEPDNKQFVYEMIQSVNNATKLMVDDIKNVVQAVPQLNSPAYIILQNRAIPSVLMPQSIVTINYTLKNVGPTKATKLYALVKNVTNLTAQKDSIYIGDIASNQEFTLPISVKLGQVYGSDGTFQIFFGGENFRAVGIGQNLKTQFMVVLANEPTLPNGYGVNLYPNPAKETAIVGLQSPKPQNVAIRLYNLQGQKVEELNYKMTQSIEKVPISLGQLPTGIYVIQTVFADGQIMSIKLLVDK